MFVSIHLSLTPLWQSGQAETAIGGAASSGGCEDGFSRDPNRTQHYSRVVTFARNKF